MSQKRFLACAVVSSIVCLACATASEREVVRWTPSGVHKHLPRLEADLRAETWTYGGELAVLSRRA